MLSVQNINMINKNIKNRAETTLSSNFYVLRFCAHRADLNETVIFHNFTDNNFYT